jgi:hypothetical protein
VSSVCQQRPCPDAALNSGTRARLVVPREPSSHRAPYASALRSQGLTSPESQRIAFPPSSKGAADITACQWCSHRVWASTLSTSVMASVFRAELLLNQTSFQGMRSARSSGQRLSASNGNQHMCLPSQARVALSSAKDSQLYPLLLSSVTFPEDWTRQARRAEVFKP